MVALIVIIIVVALAIIFGGSALGNVLSSPETRALTRLVASHRFEGPLARAEAVGGIFSIYGLDASGTREAKASDIAERRRKLLADAREFDARYGRFHGDIRAEDILKSEMGQRLDDL